VADKVLLKDPDMIVIDMEVLDKVAHELAKALVFDT